MLHGRVSFCSVIQTLVDIFKGSHIQYVVVLSCTLNVPSLRRRP